MSSLFVSVQEYKKQKAVQASTSDSRAKTDIHKKCISELEKSFPVTKTSGVCAESVNKESSVIQSKLKQLCYVIEPPDFLNSSSFPIYTEFKTQ